MNREDLAHQHHVRRAAEIRHYSVLVRWMKFLLPIAAMVLIGMIFIQGNDRGAVIDMQSTADAAALSAGLTLENPRFAGMTEDGQPFVVTAKSALPDGAAPDRIELDAPVGEIRLGDGITLTVTANAGEMYRNDEQLHLNGSVTLESSNGYTAKADVVELDLTTKTATVPGPVEADGPRGGISADRMELRQEQSESRALTAVFQGNVRVVLLPSAD
ncbi:MAG: LPS export ABC transporter periplasmic protein LptC [Pseudomonadota bacterium]